MKQLTLAITIMAFFSNPAIAADRIVKCRIDSSGEPGYRGSCLFVPDTKGSFSLENPNKNQLLTRTVSSVSVTIVKKGVAEVRGLTTDGINARWGIARRSARDKACWQGEDFTVCAW